MPGNLGIASFIAMVGTDLTPIYISILIQFIINPDNLEPTIDVTEGQKVLKYFDHEVADNVPMFFKTYGIMIIIMGIVFPLFIKDEMGTTNKVVEKMASLTNSNNTSLNVSDEGNEQSNLMKISQFYENTNLSINKSYLDVSGTEVDCFVPNVPYMNFSGTNLTLNISKSLNNTTLRSNKNSYVKEMISLEGNDIVANSSKERSINAS